MHPRRLSSAFVLNRTPRDGLQAHRAVQLPLFFDREPPFERWQTYISEQIVHLRLRWRLRSLPVKTIQPLCQAGASFANQML